ncbi:multicopper oxidase domain-containing protein [Pseudonocardia asaccharolytica]|uniref:Copper-containing nitrite reductase n=1 Tax=Pseudonocardia asaccharolytica DSM 44247 = NBRC 16224 TaxID=1123024 RepID=A0A511D8S3_9PSEU|nr:multicopper oxidase domain-containing protein [Pseudonocardia asaccharolytica]GEL20803.1 multicopper oxidase [Pseudonocardia asaccharolytica DSM 44247 = NBRC 16224]
MRSKFWPLRDIPAVFWLVALLVVTLVHPFVAASGWLMIHLLLLGAVTHSIMVWSSHFAETLLHAPTDATQRRRQSWRLALLNGGAAVVVAGMVAGTWGLTLAGACLVAAAVAWHGAALVHRLRRALPSRFRPLVRYYIVAALCLPVGAGLGATAAYGLADPLHDRFVLAHVAVNVLGWIGLTVVGTLVTLWPTMLRTRISEGAERAAYRALPVLVGAVVVTAAGALSGLTHLAAAGVLGYLGGLALVAPSFVTAARAKPPAAYPTWSVLAAMVWLAGSLVALTVAVASAPSWAEAGARLSWLTAPLAAGFGAQVLLGALSYLVPVVLGGGPAAVRAANTEFERAGALRITVINGGLLVCVLPVPSVVRVLCSVLVLVGLAAFLPLMFRGMRASRRIKVNPPPPSTRKDRAGPAVGAVAGRRGGLATGLTIVVLAVAAGVAADPTALGVTGSVPTVQASGETTRVEVAARDMRFTPSRIEVPAGNRLIIELTNTDEQDVHDLVLETGQRSDRLAPGASATVDAGVIGRHVAGWCSIVGHRQMGMVLDIVVTGTDAPEQDAAGQHDMGGHAPSAATRAGSADSAAADLDFMAAPGPQFTAHDPALAPLEDATVHRHTFTAQELDRDVAPGVAQHLWTFNGTAPGPTLHGKVGDVFEITLVNDGTIGHSIDFHAGSLAPDQPMRTIKPGESLVYRFTANRAGIWMYHCSTMPMSAHIANGMFGAVIIDPPNLPPVDHSYVLVQSELYLGPQHGTVDVNALQAEKPDAVVFNGYANQYDHRPLTARVGERVRIWVLAAGPNRAAAFHIVGGQFDTVYAEGAYQLRPDGGAGGSQTLGLVPSQGGFVELVFPEAGHYPFVSHAMIDAERGAHGIIEVTD